MKTSRLRNVKLADNVRKSGKSQFRFHSSKSMSHYPACIVLVLIFVMIYVWILLITHFAEYELTFGSDTKGLTWSLEKDKQHFKIQGFEYHDVSPAQANYPHLTSRSVWFLKPEVQHGKIQLKDISTKIRRQTHVSILLKYFIKYPNASRLFVTGKNAQSQEAVVVEMSQYGDGYCSRVLFLGMVHEIAVEGTLSNSLSYVIIDELLVGFGYFVFDGLDEETCS